MGTLACTLSLFAAKTICDGENTGECTKRRNVRIKSKIVDKKH